MLKDFTWKIGGQQGEGIESAGEILAAVLNKLGYFLYAQRHFSSRIKGGHTTNTLRISTNSVGCLDDQIHLLLAFDEETLTLNRQHLAQQGVALADGSFHKEVEYGGPDNDKAPVLSIPLAQLAGQAGNPLMKNIVALGASAQVLGIETEAFRPAVAQVFGKKGGLVVEQNMTALRHGSDYIQERKALLPQAIALVHAPAKKHMFLMGNEAIALGALAGGARLMPAYPITPASEIMEYLIEKLPDLGGAVVQTEDEIAAVAMAIGANYAGVRSFTASSGPGLSLMSEAIGLSGMTETPLVVVCAQRGGPSTGLPTKQEQSDLLAMIYGSHGELPKIVMAPSTVEEAFYDMAEAFNLAEEYQCPVILLSDVQLSLGKQTVEPFQYDRVQIRRGSLLAVESMPQLQQPELFKRYQLTDSGISPRSIPGMPNGMHHVTGLEHDETGRPSEDSTNRKAQMDKRLGKLRALPDWFKQPLYKNTPHAHADLLLVGMLSTRGVLEEVKAMLELEGLRVNHVQVRLLNPFPDNEMNQLLKAADQVAVVEVNATGQLAHLICMHTGLDHKISKILKYDGSSFGRNQLYQRVKEVLGRG